MSGLEKTRQLLAARFVDGELSRTEHAEFERRLAADGALRAAVEELREHRRVLHAADPVSAGATAPAGFAAAVLDRVKRMPSRDELVRITDDEDRVAEVVGFARRLLVAAAVIFAIGLVLGFVALQRPAGDELHAWERKTLDEIDAKIQANKQAAFQKMQVEPRRR